jgi:hypothetical protein
MAIGSNYPEMKLPSTTAESLKALLGRVRAIQRELEDTTTRMEVALGASYESQADDPRAILREVRDRLTLSETSLNNVVQHANAALISFGA